MDTDGLAFLLRSLKNGYSLLLFFVIPMSITCQVNSNLLPIQCLIAACAESGMLSWLHPIRNGLRLTYMCR